MSMTCPKCRTKLATESKFCLECGLPIGERENQSAGVSSMNAFLNWRQKCSLWTGIILVALVGLCPPWMEVTVFIKGNLKLKEMQIGHHSIFNPPTYPYHMREPGRFRMYKIDFERLGVIWAIIAVFTGGFIVTMAGNKSSGKFAFHMYRSRRKPMV